MTDLTDGVTYYYRVKCRDAARVESRWSNIVNSRQDATPPTAPGRPMDAGAFTSRTTVRFDWTAASDTVSGVASYDVQVGFTPGGWGAFDGSVGNVLTKTVTGANGQTLYAHARARDRVGNIGPWSANSDGITVDTVRPRLIGAAGRRDGQTVDITFDEPVRNAHIPYYYSITGGTLDVLAVEGLSAALYRLHTTGQTPGTIYTVTVSTRVVDRAGNAITAPYNAASFVAVVATGSTRWGAYH